MMIWYMNIVCQVEALQPVYVGKLSSYLRTRCFAVSWMVLKINHFPHPLVILGKLKSVFCLDFLHCALAYLRSMVQLE